VGHGQPQRGLPALPAEFAEELAHVRGRVLALPVLEKKAAAKIPIQSLRVIAAVLEIGGPPPEAAAAELQRGSMPGASVLRLDRERAAQRVQAEQRIRSRHQSHLRDGDARNQFPAYDVTEGLVEPHAVHVYRQALRRP